MEQYEEEIKNLLKKTLVTKDDVFKFSFTPNEKEFAETFLFYRQTLDEAAKWGVTNSHIFFINDVRVNAYATAFKGVGVIGINSGLMLWLIQNLKNRKEIDDLLRIKYNNIYESLDNPLNVLLYQVAQHFTFYHELAHLIQKSEFLNHLLYELPQQESPYSIITHKLEMDADSFSALATAAHIHQYIFKIFGENITNDNVESVIELFCSGILLYFLSFDSFKDEMYYQESSHPHAAMRLINVILIISHYCRQSPRLIEKGVVLNHNRIIDKTMENAMEIEFKVFGESKAKTLTEILGIEKKNILNYYSQLRELEVDQFIMAENMWNEALTQREKEI